jgi:hypothetical protein
VTRRLKLGIPAAAPTRHWTPEEDGLLGTMPDKEAAMVLCRTIAAIGARREQLGLPPSNPKWRPWTRQEDALLGTQPDKDIARLLGRTPKMVLYRRMKLGVPYRKPQRLPWTRAQERLLGRMPDAEVARRTGHPVGSVLARRNRLGLRDPSRRRQWTAEEDRLLGTAPGASVAHCRLSRPGGKSSVCWILPDAGGGHRMKTDCLEPCRMKNLSAVWVVRSAESRPAAPCWAFPFIAVTAAKGKLPETGNNKTRLGCSDGSQPGLRNALKRF